MNRYLLVFLLASSAVWAQEIPNHSIPIGGGPGVIGFRAAGPCAANQTLMWSGVTADPVCTTIAIGSLAQIGANTVLGNWTGVLANINANTMPSCADSTGNHLNYVNGTGVTCGTSYHTSATLQINPANPTGASVAGPIMMGLGVGCTITPSYSSKVRITITGNLTNTVTAAANGAIAKYGTGTAPVNGAAVTGTSLGATAVYTTSAANSSGPFSVGGIATGLTPGTAYWLDLGVSDIGAVGVSAVQNVTCSAFEVP